MSGAGDGANELGSLTIFQTRPALSIISSLGLKAIICYDRIHEPYAVVMVDEDAEHPLEMAAVKDQEPVQTLDSDRADEALGDRVRRRRLEQAASSAEIASAD
jgi:hypothetical protein